VGTAVSSLACAKEATTVPTSFPNPNTPNPFHPFPDEATRQQADEAATALMRRYAEAQRAMNLAARDQGRTPMREFFELAEASREMHRMLMLGWWADQPF
jgi:hypothetical protein